MDNMLLMMELTQLRRLLVARSLYDTGKITKDVFVELLASETDSLKKMDEILNTQAKEVFNVEEENKQ